MPPAYEPEVVCDDISTVPATDAEGAFGPVDMAVSGSIVYGFIIGPGGNVPIVHDCVPSNCVIGVRQADGFEDIRTTAPITFDERVSGGAVDPDAVCTGVVPVPDGYTVRNGTTGPDTLHGTVGKDLIYGRGGNDTIYGYAEDDILCGGPGADRLFGGPGADGLAGGYGNDRNYGQGGNDGINGGAGTDIVNGGDGRDRAYDTTNDTYVAIEEHVV